MNVWSWETVAREDTAFQNCRERRWYSWQGGSYGYFWINGYWQSNYEVRTWWAFNWYDFQRRVW